MKILIFIALSLCFINQWAQAQLMPCEYSEISDMVKDTKDNRTRDVYAFGTVIETKKPDTYKFHIEKVLFNPWGDYPEIKLDGKDIVVFVKNSQLYKMGDQFVLVAYGDDPLRLRELAHMPATCLETATLAINNVDDDLIKERLDTATLVVAGKVLRNYLLRARNPNGGEHDPDLYAADIAVYETLKGAPKETIQVLFVNYVGGLPNGTQRGPSFKEGKEGVFILKGKDHFAAPKEIDVQPLSALSKIKKLLQ